MNRTALVGTQLGRAEALGYPIAKARCAAAGNSVVIAKGDTSAVNINRFAAISILFPARYFMICSSPQGGCGRGIRTGSCVQNTVKVRRPLF
jgi:hypothetical protein